jgi:hypothetical protein
MNIARLAKEGGFGQIRRLYEIVRIPLKGKLAPVSMIPDVDVKNNVVQLYVGCRFQASGCGKCMEHQFPHT